MAFDLFGSLQLSSSLTLLSGWHMAGWCFKNISWFENEACDFKTLFYVSEWNANITTNLPSSAPVLLVSVCVCGGGFAEIILSVSYDPGITFPILDTFEIFLLSNEKDS